MARFHRTLDQVRVPARPITAKLSPDFRLAIATGLLAVVALALTSALGGVHAPSLHKRLIAFGGTAGFVVLSVFATRSAGNELARVLEPRTGRSHADVVRLLVTLAGYMLTLLTALGLLAVPVQHLLLGGALTGVIIGIAAQQALSNLFAGLVLLLARPFNVGDRVRIRSGALGGVIDATVLGMGMTYVTVETADGPTSLPNATLLNAGIGPAPAAQEREAA